MMDGQTDLMQHVFDPGLLDPVRPLPADYPPDLRPSLRSPDHAAPADFGIDLARISVRHVGRLVADHAEQPRVRELVTLLLRPDAQESLDAFVDSLLERGLPVEHIYLRLFQPAARRLGEFWADDVCSFVDVTLAMALLQGGMRRLAPRFQRHARPVDGRRSVLLATLGRDQHTFGLTMTAEFFRRSGWAVSVAGADDLEDVVRHAPAGRGLVVGLSVSRVDQLPALSALIRRLRRGGEGRIAGILVGGPLVTTHPEFGREVGADAVGRDARQALAEAEALAAAAEEAW